MEKPSSTCPYLVRVAIDDLNIRKGPGTDYQKTGKYTGKGTFTIVEDRAGKGSKKGWGRLDRSRLCNQSITEYLIIKAYVIFFGISHRLYFFSPEIRSFTYFQYIAARRDR